MNPIKRKILIFCWIACLVIAFSLLIPHPVYADDCLSDPLNAADCMRTPLFRPAIAVIMSVGSALVTILVNILSGAATAAGAAATGAAAGAATTGSTAGAAAASAAPSAATSDAPKSPTPTSDKPPAPGIIDKIQGSTEAGLQNIVASPWWDLTKIIAAPSSTIIGSMSEFLDFREGAETVQKIRDSLRVWQKNPTKEAAEEYLKNLRGTTNSRLQKLGGALDVFSKGVDLVDAVGNGLKKANDRGFTGIDKVLTVGAEMVKKDLAWLLTKNPVVGLADAALGGATEMIYGKGNRIDIGSTIDKGADAWDQTTQEYFNNTQGGSDADAQNQVQDNFLRFLRRIKGQVDKGQISRETGSARIKHLRDVMLGG
jgi:hypothetical protein